MQAAKQIVADLSRQGSHDRKRPLIAVMSLAMLLICLALAGACAWLVWSSHAIR